MGCSKEDLQYQPSGGRTGRPRKMVVDGKQQCSTCREWKPLDDFYAAKHTFNKKETRCNTCTKVRVRNYFEHDLERYLKYLCKAHKSVGHKSIGGRTTPRRKAMHAESELTTEILLKKWNDQQGLCAVTRIPMTRLRGAGHSVLTNVSFDRIDSNIGYIESNVRLVCKAVNYMKHAMTDQEMLEWCRAILAGPLNDNSSLSPAEGKNCITGIRI